MLRRFSSVMIVPTLLLSLVFTSARAQTGWVAQSSPVATHLRALDFVTSEEGWICGDAGVILHTTDGGKHWISQFSGTTRDLFAVSFPDTRVGFAVGEASTVLRTTDGGFSWTAADFGDPYSNVAVHAVDPLHIWIAGTGVVPVSVES
jgi:photosystem II stability/assembly factor-like uncharacterized protein